MLGLAIGSFLNVVVYRLPGGMSLVRPASHCPACGTTLGSFDLVPVLSWLALRGRCRHCRTSISPRYPLVELTTGAAFAALGGALQPPTPLPSLMVVTAAALAAVLIAADGAPVPLTLCVLCLAGALTVVAPVLADGQPLRVAWAALGAALVAACTFATAGRRSNGRLERTALLAAFGWSVGALWAPAGPLAAGWVLLAYAATTTARRPVSGAPIALVAAGAFALVVLSAAVGWP